MPEDLKGWKAYFLEHFEEARCAAMSDEDREELIAFIRREAESIFYGPLPERPPQESAPVPWWDR